MDKESVLKALIIVALMYYLTKGILYLLLYQVLKSAEERGLKRAAKSRKAIEELRKNRGW